MENHLIHSISIWTDIWDDADTDREAVEAECYKLQLDDPTGIINANKGAWHSSMDLYDNPVLSKVNKRITDYIKQYIIPDGYPLLKNKDVIFDTNWFILAKKDEYMIGHMHPETWYSALFYVKVPENCSSHTMLHSPYTRYLIPALQGENETALAIEPVEGKVLFFPSWYWHSVKPSEEDTDRITLAATFKWAGGPRANHPVSFSENRRAGY